jgi:signal transduction histidine kinase
MPLQVTQFPLDEVIREVMEELQGVIAQAPASVHITMPTEVPKMKSDRQKLKQILVNLLSNALKYTKEGRVDIMAESDLSHGRIRLKVKDSGVGIAAEDHTRIFEPFQQAKRVITRPQGGTGLGLAISRRLARMLGGDISLESALGQGSTFTVELPVRVRTRGGSTASDVRLSDLAETTDTGRRSA